MNRKGRLARIVLTKLEHEPKRWTELLKLTMMDCGTPATFRSIMLFLLRRGYVEHPVERGPYRITDRGRRFLELF